MGSRFGESFGLVVGGILILVIAGLFFWLSTLGANRAVIGEVMLVRQDKFDEQVGVRLGDQVVFVQLPAHQTCKVGDHIALRQKRSSIGLGRGRNAPRVPPSVTVSNRQPICFSGSLVGAKP